MSKNMLKSSENLCIFQLIHKGFEKVHLAEEGGSCSQPVKEQFITNRYVVFMHRMSMNTCNTLLST